MTGVQPLVGRAFRSGEDVPGGPKVTVLSHKLYRDKFGSDPSAIGTNIRINGTPFETIGVMPPGFAFPANDDLWVPLQNDPMATPRGEGLYPTVVGIRKAGVSLSQASAELSTIGKRLASDYPKASEGFTMAATDFVDWSLGPEPRQVLSTMLGAVLFVLLIACTNVANLLLDRAANRSKEVGIRSALGAPRYTIIRLFLAEALVLAAVGAGLGLALAYVGIGVFNRAIVDTPPPFFISISLYPPVIAFAAGVALLATIFSGVIPAFQASRIDIAATLKDESRGSSSLRVGKISKALVVFELALSCGYWLPQA